MSEKEILKELIKSIELRINLFEERLNDIEKELVYYGNLNKK